MLSPQLSEIFHDLAHTFHALSDLTFNFGGPEPRRLMCYPRISPINVMPQIPHVHMSTGASQQTNSSHPPSTNANSSSTQSQVSNSSLLIDIHCPFDK